MQNELEKSNSNFPNKNKAQAIWRKSSNFRFSGSFCSDLGIYLQNLSHMQNEKNQNEKALEALLNDLPAEIAAETIQTLFLGYIPTDAFCESMVLERHNTVYAANVLINFFNQIGGKK